MTEFLVLALWMSAGAILAASLTPVGSKRFAWAPVAVFLGPLWVSVARDRRAVAAEQEMKT